MPSQWKHVGNAALKVTLTGKNNHTLEGLIHLQDSDILEHLVSGIDPSGDHEVTTAPPGDDYDPKGASAYAIVVIFVYGFSIVLLIASHIFLKKKEDKKDGENEKEITKYLEQAPTLQRKSEKESFRKLKKSIIPLVSVGMLAEGVANIPERNRSIPRPAGVQKERRDSQRTRHGNQSSQRSNDDDNQISPLLSDSLFSAKKSFTFDGNDEPNPQIPAGHMPTIFEGAENESIKSQDDNEQYKGNRTSSPWNQSNIIQNMDQRYAPLVHGPKPKQYKVRILEPKRQIQRDVPNTPPARPSPYNVVQCPGDQLKRDDEQLLQVTVL